MNLQRKRQFQSQNATVSSSALPFLLVLILSVFAGTSEGADDIRLFFLKGSGTGSGNVIRIMTGMEVDKCIELDEALRSTEWMRINAGCVLIYQGPGCTDRRVSIRRLGQVNLKEKQIIPMSIKREACDRKPKDDHAELRLYGDAELKNLIATKRSLEMEYCTPIAEWKQPILGVSAVRGCFVIYEGFDCTGKQLMLTKFSKGDLTKSELRPESVRKVKCNYR